MNFTLPYLPSIIFLPLGAALVLVSPMTAKRR
jgi:hypothetical protein